MTDTPPPMEVLACRDTSDKGKDEDWRRYWQRIHDQSHGAGCKLQGCILGMCGAILYDDILRSHPDMDSPKHRAIGDHS
jgi:hypothetical protein